MAEKSANISEFQKVNQSFFSSLVLNIRRLLPGKCRCLCLKETTKDRLFAIGYKKMRKEIEIGGILKRLRVVKAAVKRNFTETEWAKFKGDNDTRLLHLTKLTETSKFRSDSKEAKPTMSPLSQFSFLNRFSTGLKPPAEAAKLQL